MSVSHLEILVEEPSMETALRLILPQLVGDRSFNIYAYQCKDDLLKRLPSRLRGYASWLPDSYRILVIIDRDDDDCVTLKGQLEQIALEAGLRTRSQSGHDGYQAVTRLAIEELEAWYFGDWKAVRAAYPRVPESIPSQARYRDPDAISGGTWEAFERVLQRAGYFKTGLRKIEAAGAVAQHWQPMENRSASFQSFRDVVLEMSART